MRSWLVVGLWAAFLSGCAPPPNWPAPPGPPVTVFYDNPCFVPIANHEQAWETVASVIGEYFKIEREEPVRLIGNTLTEGRIDTFPIVGATLLEPWHHDSANFQERVESTLQSIRRKAVVRVVPTQGGYWVDVTVLKELEDLPRPELATAGAATLRYDSSLTRVVNPVGAQPPSTGWIPQGRDAALEQRILGHLQARCGRGGGTLPPIAGVPAGPAAAASAALPGPVGPGRSLP